MNNMYAIDYMRRALSADTLEPPDDRRAGRFIEVLTSLYEAHQMGGTKVAMMAWTTLKMHRPDVARQFDYQRHVYTSQQLSNIPRLAYIMDEYPIYEGASNLIVGQRGTGKSFFGVDVACRVSQHDRVLYIAAEGAGVYDGRVKAWHTHHNQQQTGKLYFYGHPVNVGSSADFTNFVQLIVEPIEPQLIVVDTVARCMVGMDENSSSDMKTFVARWDTLRERGITLLFVHHTNRGGTQRGSGVLDDAADSVLFLHRTDGAISVRNDLEGGGKNKGHKEAAPLYFQIQTQEVPPDYMGDEASAVLVKVDRRQIDLSEVDALSDRQLRILDAVEGVDEGLSPADIGTYLGDVSKSALYRQLTALTKAGYLNKQASMYSLTEQGETALESNREVF